MVMCPSKNTILKVLKHRSLRSFKGCNLAWVQNNRHICGKWIQNGHSLEEHSSNFDIYNKITYLDTSPLLIFLQTLW